MSSSATTSVAVLKAKLFAGLNDSALQAILGAAQVRRSRAQQNLTTRGERSDHLFLLRSGRARFYVSTKSGSEVNLLWAVPGDVIGLVSLLEHPPAYMASAEAVSDCEFLAWSHQTLRNLTRVYPLLTENGFRLALQYLGTYMKRHTRLFAESAESRLAHTLRQLATEVGNVHSSGVVIDITNEQLSSLSDISVFTASRLISQWEREGKLSKERGRITVLAPESLILP